MIKIEKVFGIDGVERRLQELESDYCDAVSENGALSTRIQTIAIASPQQAAIINYIDNNLKILLTGRPSDLKSVIEHFTVNSWHTEIFSVKRNKTKLTSFGELILATFDYESFRTSKSKGIWLAEKLNIKTCPYCNAHYTLTIRTPLRKVKAKFQFDHFFYQRRFPYLSTSLYNLIPSCANCNISKSSRSFELTTHYHPYHSSLSNKSYFQLDSASLLTALLSGEVRRHPVKVTFVSINSVYDAMVKEHDNIFDINAMYESHQDVAQELLIKAIIYNKSAKEEIMEIKNLFPDEETYLSYLLGNYPYKDQILKRPLAKYVQDLAQQLKLI
jgi:hypothetical protein